ncbi:MAG: hypothetical protein A2921_02255 [Candidatus Magasanikbacteria bacterium RIFCSPLOWO2_01_FULL_43_20b]|uniref:Radical SAM core domain-containing protein n=1 Tax=Candidatus Magasanikbacteria bacterium RIFCSPLOWO2_12_FULL_43_12 TaxID=1798692 RepID=A0A1F6MVC1_9BACT|nr:MAG: hypothetical protein A3C74_00580 [Candidatus Magasanikbacteria bacterium RIFCSPHIGHO2_02_FULL_44_13]OGH72321.1 MAG: hypothetical protein A3I93_04540 [Candidatus Magasanikbacteria bacterium RIFCSPLOWO2_02_FULL_43_22]OGH73406.1 MAG: hypothetical protein A2921_02255 [Candidatus Magasanikbacteria bacterium RIFCSPLOWO2_01_FULL_43_20b]OGH75594.1 MAG: hypothetical protein A3G00_03795 [Candidatus Magasanikbacteria bacterium RIFCSPLOWO2_12_FULL_43_12]
MNTLAELLTNEPKYRLKQIQKAWFDLSLNSYEEITTLPVELREKLKNLPWLSVKLHTILKSKIDGTEKALLELSDGELIETVLMVRESLKENKEASKWPVEERHTICISSQVGCAMNCFFCATGKAGFKRNLTTEEIVDQYRFWQRRLTGHISNIVVMGQGEPLLNYDNLKNALNIILNNTEIGPTKITVSTCGIPEQMEKLLADKDFPQVCWAISLHSAIEETRKKIMPAHRKDFVKFLVDWSRRYHELIPSRTHFIGLEYLMLAGVNDDEKHRKALEKLANKIPRVKINLIPYNDTNSPGLSKTSQTVIDDWHDYLMKAGFVCTIRHSQGQDIAAACGQLCNRTTTDAVKNV